MCDVKRRAMCDVKRRAMCDVRRRAMCDVKRRDMCDVKRRDMCDVHVTACLLCLVLFQAVCVNATPEGAVRVKRSGDVSTATPQTLGDLEMCQASLMMTMQAEMTSLRSKVENLESLKNTVTTLENNVTSLKNTVTTLENDVTSLESTVSWLEDRLYNMQNASSLAVAFTARISADRDRGGLGLSLGYHQTVVFNDVLTNVGNAYNNHTGLFTAPVDGTYVFFLTVMGVGKHHDPNSETIYLVIVKNGIVLDLVFAHGGINMNAQGSTLLTTQLRQGDHVWVRHDIGKALRGNKATVFTGYLLHAQ